MSHRLRVAVVGCALLGLAGGCVGERPPTALPPVDQPKVQARCQGDSTRLLGDINVSKASDLTLFAGCRDIVGNVVIENAIGVEDLSLLEPIDQISGFLYIGHNPDLLTTEALNGIQRIGRGISVEGNPQLGIAEFDGLTEAFGNIVFEDNPALTRISLSGIDILEPALVDIDGQGTLAPQGGALILANNPLVDSVDVSALQEVDGSVDIRGMDALASLTGFDALVEISGSLSFGVGFDDRGDVVGEPNLTLSSLDALSQLEFVGGDLVIGFSPVLASLGGLGALEDVEGDVVVFENAALSTLGGLSSLERIGGDLNIGQSVDFEGNFVAFGNPVLRTIDLDAVEAIGGDIVVAGNLVLETLRDMEELVTVGGDIVLLANSGLENLELPPNLLVIPNDFIVGEFTRPNGETSILNNIVDDFGTPLYTEINGDFTIVGQTPASNLDAFANVTRIGGTLTLVFTEITSTEGMAALTSLGGLEIGRPSEFLDAAGQQASAFNNPGLETIAGFDALTQWESVSILGSPALTTIDLGTIPVVGDLSIAGPTGVETLSLDVASVGGDLSLGTLQLPSGRRYTFGDQATTTILFPSLTNVGGNLRIDELALLDTATLDALASVGGDVEVFGLGALESLNVPLLTTTGGDFSVEIAPALTTLTHALATVGQTLRLIQTPAPVVFDTVTTVGGDVALDEISGDDASFAVLATVDGDVRVERAPDLTTLDGFATLQTVGGDVVLVENPLLTTAAGLAGLTRVEGNIIARDNTVLDVTTVQTVADALEEDVAVLTCGNADDDAC